VLQKAGLAQEGRRREYVAARGREETIETHGILRWEWEARRRPQGLAPAALRPDVDRAPTESLG
jgi:hypothetical protein